MVTKNAVLFLLGVAVLPLFSCNQKCEQKKSRVALVSNSSSQSVTFTLCAEGASAKEFSVPSGHSEDRFVYSEETNESKKPFYDKECYENEITHKLDLRRAAAATAGTRVCVNDINDRERYWILDASATCPTGFSDYSDSAACL